ncbi:hypothetical protein LOK49_LG07G01634 [Camellia lanceoleosa]|uniref:Uncharacterized protein n=1 Tax=Camellia lanceoleosa TaxID=1840588 RepID=A0ACC0H5G3_9ERIC|nr:hypothetical protein LOK49_LG07G01634 [Camellia lanceoleosa]
MIFSSISRQNYPEWLLAAVYASPNPKTRDELLDNLEDIAHNNHMPRLLAGDFNDHTGLKEKRSFSTNQNLNQSQSHGQKFVTHINNCKLMDLGYTGPSLTWSNNIQGWAKTLSHLDRALYNAEWRTRFPEGFARNLPRILQPFTYASLHPWQAPV